MIDGCSALHRRHSHSILCTALSLSSNVAAQANDDTQHHCHQERHDQDHGILSGRVCRLCLSGDNFANFLALEPLIRCVQPLILLFELLTKHRDLVPQLHCFGFNCPVEGFSLLSRICRLSGWDVSAAGLRLVFDHLLHYN